MKLSVLLFASLYAAAPLPQPKWGRAAKAAVAVGGLAAVTAGGVGIAVHVNKAKQAKKLQDEMLLEALMSPSSNPSSNSASSPTAGATEVKDAGTEFKDAATEFKDAATEVHPFVSLKETPPFPDKNPMAQQQ